VEWCGVYSINQFFLFRGWETIRGEKWVWKRRENFYLEYSIPFPEGGWGGKGGRKLLFLTVFPCQLLSSSSP